MKKALQIWKDHSLCLFFLFVIIIIGLFNLPTLYKSALAQYRSYSLDTSVAEKYYEDNFWHHEDFVDFQGLAALLSGQEINNGVIKGLDGSLYLETDAEYVFDEQTERKNTQDTVKILKAAESAGADVLYVQRVYKTGELPYGYVFQQDIQYDFWKKTISNSGFPVLDIKEEMSETLEFYKTDHHWRVESAFEAAGCIVKRLNEEYGLALDSGILNAENYSFLKWEDSFLGSMGIRTGKYFAGKDDFVMPVPNFNTDLTYRHFVDGVPEKEMQGSFSEAFLDMSILNDPNYNNKYNACLNGGYAENIVINRLNPEGNKVLVISDSFARPLVQYLSLCFGETRYLDPQRGRYNESYIEYIQEYQPDIVIVMYSADFATV